MEKKSESQLGLLPRSQSPQVVVAPHFKPSATAFRICEVFVFFLITSALVYSYKCLWDLRYEFDVLRRDLEATLKFAERERETALSPASGSFGFDAEDDGPEGFGMRRKREIRASGESSPERVTSGEKGTTPTWPLSAEYYSDYSGNNSNESSNRNQIPTTRKPRRNHRKGKKHSRVAVSAEKFYTQMVSTTTTPIQIRQSRTKSTDSFENGKHKRGKDRKPILQAYGSKESITREEALRRPIGTRNLIPERIPQMANWLRASSEGARLETLPQRELIDSITYNMITVHFAANTSHYSRERDLHYYGNGRMKTKAKIYKDWTASHWTQGMDVSRFFHLSHGKVKVSVTGIYLIYAQIQYSNVQEVNGYEVYCNKQAVVHCITTSAHPDKDELKSNTCDTSTTILLHADDHVYIQDLHEDRHVVLTPEKSYFGLILLSPFKDS